MIETVLLRFLIVWGVLNLILLPIEWYRWQRAKKAHWSWRGYVDHFMWDFTDFVLIVDAIFLALSILGPIVYWIIQPAIN